MSKVVFRPTLEDALIIENIVGGALPGFGFYRVGSFYRKTAIKQDKEITIGDIDIVFPWKSATPINNFCRALWGNHNNGNPKRQGLIGRISVDIKMVAKENLGAALVFYRCPPALQIALRAIANSQGMSFSGKHLRRGGEVILTPTEASLYRCLGVTPFTPEQLVVAESYKIEEKLRPAVDIQGSSC